MKNILTIALLYFFALHTHAQKIDWNNAPKNPIPLKYTLNHFQLMGDIKAREEFGFNGALFTRYHYTFNPNGLLEQSVYVNKREPLKSDITTFLYNNDGTVASKTTKTENTINLIQTFKYNKKKQLIEAVYDNKKYPQHNSNTLYEYHSNGWLKKSTQFKDAKEIESSEYEYDNLNRVIYLKDVRNKKLSQTIEYSYNKASNTILEVFKTVTYFNTDGNKIFNNVETYNNGFLIKENESFNIDYALKFDSQNNLLESAFRKLGDNFGGLRCINIYYNQAHNIADDLIDIGCVAGNCNDGYGTYLLPGQLAKAFFTNSEVTGLGVFTKTNGNTTKMVESKARKNTKSIVFSKNEMIQYVNFIDQKPSGNYYVVENGKTTIAQVENGAIKQKYDNAKNYTSVRCLTGDCDNGFGSILADNGDVLNGFFNNSQATEGILKLSSGHIYIGAFENGKKFKGLGVLMFPNGDRYMGFWENGLRHGQGVFQYANGSEEAGIWSYDVLKTKM